MRTLTISQETVQIFLTHKRHQSLNKAKWTKDNKLIFPNTLGQLGDEKSDQLAFKNLLKAAGVPAAVSLSAGTFVCNHLFYSLQHHLQGSAVRSGFMHVPLMDQQRVEFAGLPTMPLAQMVAGVMASIKTL